MASREEYPNILILTGSKYFGDQWREEVKKTIFPSFSPLRGKVDFVICYPVDGDGSNHGGVDHSFPGRPLRGIIKISKDLRSEINASNLEPQLQLIAHEVGHYWLVPGRAKINTPEGTVDTPTSTEIALSLQAGTGMPPYPIIGRQDSHWSPFIDTKGSPMDGISHSPPNLFLERGSGLVYTRGEKGTGFSFDVSGLGPVTFNYRYSDLELYLMGVLRQPTFNPAENFFDVIEPKWVFPNPFHSGLYVEFDNGYIWYHGFYQSPLSLVAQRIDEYQQEDATILSSPYNPRDRVALRVVQEGASAKLQARVWAGDLYALASGCIPGFIYRILEALGGNMFVPPKNKKEYLPPLKYNQVMRDLILGRDESSDDVYHGWKTFATIPSRVKRMGLAARHHGDFLAEKCFVRTSAHYCLLQGTEVTGIRTTDMTLENALDPENTLVHTLLSNGDLILPYYIPTWPDVDFLPEEFRVPTPQPPFKHTIPSVEEDSDQREEEDSAPRVVIDAPSEGDFAFGGQVKIEECIILNYAGGSALNKTFVGKKRRQVSIADIDYSEHWIEYDKRAEPLEGKYNFMFCLISKEPLEEEDLLQQLAGLDLIRRSWEPCFEELTYGHRLADTTIEDIF